MPYAILRFQKRKAGGVAACERHNERKKEAYKSNPDIDMERSKNNYHLIAPPKYTYKNLGVVHSLEIVQEYGFALFFRQSTDCFKKQLRRDFLPGSFKGDFPFEIFIKGMKLPRFF